MHHQKHRDKQQAADNKEQREPLEAAEIAGACRSHDQDRRNDDAQRLRDAEITERQADADELGDNRQRIEQKKVDDTEGAQNLPKRSKISRACPTPETAPSRNTISW